MVEKAQSKLATIRNGSLSLTGKTIPYIVKRSLRARHIRLEVRPGTGLTIFIPRFYNIDQIGDLLKAKQNWILRHFTTYGNIRPASAGNDIKAGDVIPYLGRELKVLTTTTESGNGDHVRLELDRLLIYTSGKENLNATLECWYRIQAARLITEKTANWGAIIHVHYNRVTIRGQRTRWGSCSHKGNLNFNWKLLMTPEAVLDYVIIHELTHLKEMNHSKKFWQLVAEHCPRWREHKRWLKNHEVQLSGGLLSLRQSSCA